MALAVRVAVALTLVSSAAAACGALPAGCACGEAGARLRCRAAALRRLPPLHARLLELDVSDNNITTLPPEALQPAAALRDLNLSANRLEQGVAAGALSGRALARLWLDRCALRQLPRAAWPALLLLSVADNELEALAEDELNGARGLRVLRAPGNRLRSPPAALLGTPRLQALTELYKEHCNRNKFIGGEARVARTSTIHSDLGGNLLTALPAAALPPLPALHTLVLRRNRIAYIDESAFINTPALRVLRLEDNLLTELPAAVHRLPLLEDLSVARNRVERVGAGLRACARLARLDLRANPLTALAPRALDHLPRLHTLELSDARGLRELPALVGAARLRTLRVDRARLAALPRSLCRHAPQLRALELRGNLLDSVPDLRECAELRVLSLSDNGVRALGGGALRGLRHLLDLQLARNRLRRLPADAFVHTPRLQLLDVEGNQIEYIDSEAFQPLEGLEDLNVGNNVFPWLPAGGLRRLLHLKAHNNPNLRRFHPPELFPRIQTLVLSYAYHCCEFMPLAGAGAGAGAADGAGRGQESGEEEEEEEEGGGGFSDLVLVPAQRVDAAAWGNATDIWPHYRPFLPCVDLFDWWTLRCGVWAVFLLALLGNGTVVFVLVFSRSRIDVPRFLVTNLAAADFFMGIYLGFLAVVDAGTLGEFRAHAISWQMSAGCRLAGFLGVLSSELSVYTLAVITLERNYAITHAMHLNKRLSLRHAAAVMGAGWAFSLVAAALPLLGVSDYRKFAVCLPFETGSPAALGYVVALLAVNGLAFLVLLGCYLKMYCAIRGSQAWNSNDSRIAKRMALLVFTDFLCWSPIAFFALTAAFGAQLVSLEEAKVFTVFVLPLNSCCNPFLYAILTKQFKKDCALVCKAIEESRVTRGIGRCRHSSNFSNRQTPANTNSLAERSSRGQHGAQCACRRLLPGSGSGSGAGPGVAAAEAGEPDGARRAPGPAGERLLRWLRACGRRAPPAPPAPRPAAAPPARTGSVSSSVEFSSSRSDSWRAYGRAPPPPRRAASWLVARKTSQDSNLSSSRNDSSGSNATASTGTWRTSRSAGSGAAGAVGAAGAGVAAGAGGARPRLTRQPAVSAEEPPCSPAALPAPRLLHTIPSAAETEAAGEAGEEGEPRCAV
ncbi:lutropin-choriogonadotropic hormone receptor [Papilio machaon]|uniref:lutropin-choriogonadotropic hormone receptor n=1 Tax=Papilio machaon TaxID=76193 RepID=UPI001E664B54|nr:lutropin-choriogonadotropic hormone receptor [Papilio machaon]